QARASTEAADARARQALSSLLPQVTAAAGYTKNFGNAPDLLANSWSDSIKASQLLWDFGTTPNRWRAARAQADAALGSEKAAALLVDFNVRAAYFDARANKALMKVAQETLTNQQRHLEQTEGFVSAGTRPEIDLVQ